MSHSVLWKCVVFGFLEALESVVEDSRDGANTHDSGDTTVSVQLPGNDKKPDDVIGASSSSTIELLDLCADTDVANDLLTSFDSQDLTNARLDDNDDIMINSPLLRQAFAMINVDNSQKSQGSDVNEQVVPSSQNQNESETLKSKTKNNRKQNAEKKNVTPKVAQPITKNHQLKNLDPKVKDTFAPKSVPPRMTAQERKKELRQRMTNESEFMTTIRGKLARQRTSELDSMDGFAKALAKRTARRKVGGRCSRLGKF